MALEKMSQPPRQGEYIEVKCKQTKEAGLAVLVLPALAQIARERSYWRRVRQTASTDSLLGNMASELTEHFDDLIVTAQEAERLVGGRMVAASGAGAHFLSGWYSEVAAMMPYSTFLRSEAASLMENPYADAPDDEQRFFPDYNDAELDKSGVHIADEVISRVEGFQAQLHGQEIWYEGETIYLRARKPAEPSVQFAEGFSAQKRRMFDIERHTSVVSRMKMATWMDAS